MPNDPSDTIHLVERLRAGDRQALTDLFQRHRDRLRRMVELRMDARLQGRVDASDVIQDGFLDAATQLDNFLRGSELPPLLWMRLLVSQRLRPTTGGTWAPRCGTPGWKFRSIASACPRPARRHWRRCCLGRHTSPSQAAQSGRAATPRAGGSECARSDRSRDPGSPSLRAAQPRRDGRGVGDQRGSRSKAVLPRAEAIKGDPGFDARWIGGDLIRCRSTESADDDLLDRLARGVRRAVTPRRAALPAGISDRYPEPCRRDPRAVPGPGQGRAGRGDRARDLADQHR